MKPQTAGYGDPDPIGPWSIELTRQGYGREYVQFSAPVSQVQVEVEGAELVEVLLQTMDRQGKRLLVRQPLISGDGYSYAYSYSPTSIVGLEIHGGHPATLIRIDRF